MRARCSSGEGRVAAIRTAGSAAVGHAGNASVNVTDAGDSSAALPLMSNGSAPTTTSADPAANAAAAAAASSYPVWIPSATTVPAGPLSTKDGCAITSR